VWWPIGGYMGLVPRPFAAELTASQEGPCDRRRECRGRSTPAAHRRRTLAKLLPTMDRLSMTEARLTGYAQFPGSDCLNGGLVRVRDGRKFHGPASASHHYLLVAGHHGVDFAFLGKVFGLTVEECAKEFLTSKTGND